MPLRRVELAAQRCRIAARTGVSRRIAADEKSSIFSLRRVNADEGHAGSHDDRRRREGVRAWMRSAQRPEQKKAHMKWAFRCAR
jgi:hypothetical protein